VLQKSPELMREIVDFVDRFYARYGRSPSCREIESGTTLKRSSVHNYLVAKDEQGMIEYNGQTILTPKIRDLQKGIRQVGIVGSIACGILDLAQTTMNRFAVIFRQIKVAMRTICLLLHFRLGEFIAGLQRHKLSCEIHQLIGRQHAVNAFQRNQRFPSGTAGYNISDKQCSQNRISEV